MTGVEDKLMRVIEYIEEASVKPREGAERQRLRDIEIAEERRRADLRRGRAVQYGYWLETLEQLKTNVARHREVATTVADLHETVEHRGPESENFEALSGYLTWSEQHLEESDPYNRFKLPHGECLDLSYEEWQEWARRSTPRW